MSKKAPERTITTVIEKSTSQQWEYVAVRWSPDGTGNDCVNVRSRTGGEAGTSVRLGLHDARQLVEILHEAITAMSALEAV